MVKESLISMIFVCGGFDGEHRLNIMEIYDVRTDQWTLLEDKLPIRISNHACFSHEENKIMIIGGG